MDPIFDNVGKILISVIGLLFFVLAATLASGAKKTGYHDTARMGFNSFIVMVFVALGAGVMGFAAFGEKVLRALGFI